MAAAATMTTTTTTTALSEASTLLASIREQQASHALSIVTRSEPILEAQQQRERQEDRQDVATEEDVAGAAASLCTPSALAVDLQHYRDLFAKLRFSYLEQVSKERYLRSIVGQPPVLVSAADNAALEARVAAAKAQLRARKDASERLVADVADLARALARRHDEVGAGVRLLDGLPAEIGRLQAHVDGLRRQVGDRPDVLGTTATTSTMTLADTEAALQAARAQTAELEREIERLRRQMPARDRECRQAERDLEVLERRRNEVTAQAVEARRIRADGGRDYVGEKGKWYAAQQTVMQGLLGLEQT